MIRFAEGSLFDADVEALVNPVNTVGIMGAGLAKEFRDRYPRMFREYWEACRRGDLHRVRSVAVPALGCGLGGLDWGDVLPVIERVVGDAPWLDAHVYPPKEVAR